MESLREQLMRSPFFQHHRRSLQTSARDASLRRQLQQRVKVEAVADDDGPPLQLRSLAQVARRAGDGHATLAQVEQQLFARPRPSTKVKVESEREQLPMRRRRPRGGKRYRRKLAKA